MLKIIKTTGSNQQNSIQKLFNKQSSNHSREDGGRREKDLENKITIKDTAQHLSQRLTQRKSKIPIAASSDQRMAYAFVRKMTVGKTETWSCPFKQFLTSIENVQDEHPHQHIWVTVRH